MDYVRGVKKPKRGCVFCSLPKEKNDRESLILLRGKTCFVILNRFPYNAGHLMVIPFRHVGDYGKLKDAEVVEMARLTQFALQCLRSAFGCEGANLGMNLGKAGGAGIRQHVHNHVVPRWIGDTNFMPAIGETKSMPQHLETTYDALIDLFKEGPAK